MSIPQFAIVGRPNVGKSSLLNMIARHRVAIVDPTPGVTRDRISVVIEIDPPGELSADAAPKTIEIIDTGGYGLHCEPSEGKPDATDFVAEVECQITLAVQQADVILLVVDTQSGITPLDFTVAKMLRDKGLTDRVLVIANKVDGDKWEVDALEAAELGLGDPICISATAGHNKRRFMEALYEAAPLGGDDSRPEMHMAIIGKRNAGKSTLVNALAGEERVIVSEIPGTTRDSVDVRFEINGKTMVAIDTAGVRKSKSLQDDIEYYSQHRALRSIRRADVVLLLIDATVPISQVDKKLSQEIQQHFKPCVLVVNKWDLVKGRKDKKGRPVTSDDYLEYLTRELRGIEYAPCVFVSALKGERIRDAVALAFNLHKQSGHRETTGQLNAVMQRILRLRGPSSRLGRQAKIFYVSQVAAHPPTIALVVNHREMFDGRYQRYLLNRLREELPYSEVPIRLIFRDRKRMALNDLKAGRSARAEVED